jgi:hypothetical protein
MKNKWICIDENNCTEFGCNVEEALYNYRESMDENVKLSTLTFYELTDPYEIYEMLTWVKKET